MNINIGHDIKLLCYYIKDKSDKIESKNMQSKREFLK